jgi:hypothetical protein
MQEENQQPPQHFERRASDQLPHVTLLLDIKSDIQGIRTELVEFKRDINKAFPKDEDGLPDYAGHRKQHGKMDKEAKKDEEYKTDFVKKLYGWLGIGALGFILSAVIQYIRGGT